MAAAAAETKPRGAGLIVTLGVLTVLAAAGGAIVGKLISARLLATPAKAEAASKVSPYAGETEVKELPPIVANLAKPADARVRLQVAIVYTKKAVENPNLLMARIGDDIVAFVKTLNLAQLQGSSGLQAFREDLNERAGVRSQGIVREVIIETLVTQ